MIRGGAIGDFILTLPVLAALRQRFPDARVEVLGPPQLNPLVIAGGLADAAHSLDSAALTPLFAPGGRPDRPTAAWLVKPDLVVSFLHDPDDVFRTNVACCSKARWITGPHRPDESQLVHATDVFLKPLEQLGLAGADPTPRLTLPSPAEKPGRAGPRLALHPGSGSARKNWPEDCWAELLERLVGETDWNLILVAGEAEAERVQRLSAAVPRERLCLARHWPLLDLARVLQASTLFVGHDSGISHLAAAVGLRGLILWGDSREAIWRPRSAQMTIVRGTDGLVTLRPADVFERLNKL